MAAKLLPDTFAFYVSLGPGRSYQAVADKYGVSKRTVVRTANRERWAERIAASEAEAKRKVNHLLTETYEEMALRQIKVARFLQNKALDALRNMPLKKAMDAVRALDLSLRAERAARGEPDTQNTKDIETIIRGEYDRWMKRNDGEGEDENAASRDEDAEQEGAVR